MLIHTVALSARHEHDNQQPVGTATSSQHICILVSTQIDLDVSLVKYVMDFWNRALAGLMIQMLSPLSPIFLARDKNYVQMVLYWNGCVALNGE